MFPQDAASRNKQQGDTNTGSRARFCLLNYLSLQTELPVEENAAGPREELHDTAGYAVAAVINAEQTQLPAALTRAPRPAITAAHKYSGSGYFGQRLCQKRSFSPLMARAARRLSERRGWCYKQGLGTEEEKD